ncbi:hypothetical protein PF003_g22675 [Phytophthora fragariae]|nr:hypothetical protein PF003_g22675 [Phytophthora fragariae]
MLAGVCAAYRSLAGSGVSSSVALWATIFSSSFELQLRELQEKLLELHGLLAAAKGTSSPLTTSSTMEMWRRCRRRSRTS